MRALALILLVAPALAETRQHGDAVFDLPPDWTVGAVERGALRLLYDGPEERCEFCSVAVGPGAEATGDLAAWLASQSMILVEKEDRGAVEVVTPPEVTGTDPRPFAMMAQTVDGDVQVLFALEAGGRYQLLAFEGWATDEEELNRSLDFLGSDVAPWLDAIRYVPEGAEPLMPPPEPGSLSGLWWGWHTGFELGLDMMMTTTVEHRTIAFWPDGHFVEGTPPMGLAPFDPAAMPPGAADWGTYREGEGTLDLAFVDGRTERLVAEDGGWSDGDATLRPVEPLADGTALDGTVSSFFYTGFTPGSGVEGGVSASSETTFRPDGTFVGESFGGAFGSFEAGGGFATDSTTPGGGTYEVRDGLVVMTPADGSGARAELAFTAEGTVWIGDLALD